MTSEELHERRRQKWHVDGRPIRTLEAAREFIESVGFCLLFPSSPHPEKAQGGNSGVLLPSFFAAYAGADEGIPTSSLAFADPRTPEVTELMVRLLRERAAFEANLFAENNFLVAASLFPFFYGLAGERNPRRVPKPGTRSELSPLARDCFEAIRNKGPISKPRLRQALGGALSDAALDHALGDLWSHLRITRVDYRPEEGAFWDVLYRWAPDAVRDGIQISVPEALSALISKYLDCVIAAEASEIEDFLSRMVARSKVREAINALTAARELQLMRIGSKTMVHLTGAFDEADERKRSQPIVSRERRMRKSPANLHRSQ